MISELQKQKYIITLLGYTNPKQTNWYPWKIFYRIFRELGYTSEWLEADAIDLSSSKRRLFICWNEPDARTLVELGKVRTGDVILQKLTSLGKGCEHVKWGDDVLQFFQNWTWPIYKSFEDLYDSGVNIYAFGCKTNTELFPEKHRICEKLKDRIYWIPWGSSLYTWDEIQNAKPVTDGFCYDIGFVGSIWGTIGRGNIDDIRDYLSPLLPGRKFILAGRGTQKGPVDDEEHKEILRRSKLCPIINAASWRVEKGVQDRFWTVFTTGRFGVADTEGVYDFFDKNDVVCEPDPGEYVEKSFYFLENVEKQVPYIEKIQAKIKNEYNYYITWESIFSRILGNENKISASSKPAASCIQNQNNHDRIVSPPESAKMHGHQLIIALQNEILSLTKNRKNLVAIEIGSERGSGSTLKLSKLFKSLGLKFLTVDADKDIAAEAERIVKSVDSNFEAHHQLGEFFLSNYPLKDIAVVYMDAFDIVTDWPHKQETIESYRKRGVPLTNEMSWKMHLEASQAVYDKVINGGLICFDDVWKDENGQWQGKGKTAIPFLLNNGYRVIKFVPGHCVMLKRTTGVPATAIDNKISPQQFDSHRNVDFSEQSTPFLLVPSNDTHVHWMHPLAKALGKYCFMVISEKNERANFYLDNLGEKFLVYKNGILGQIKPNVLIFGSDWGGYEQQVIREARALGIPTVCIQEGCLDFADECANRMLHADYAFLQGPVMRKYIRKENNVFVTGNPKYDFLYETPLPDKLMVMINSNFTYGIFEEVRDQWVSDIAETCKSLGLDFFISQHPRDKGVFPSEYKVVKSDAFKLHQQLQDSSILISRFSTVIYEAAAMGREVVYYNPHHEPFRIFTYDATGGIQVAHSPSDLAQAIKSAVHNLSGNNEKRREFILQHCSTLEHDAVNKCTECLRAIAAKDTYKLSLLSQDADEQKDRNLKYGDIKGPAVSVIIPCYNTAKYLGQAIDSVLSQTYGDFEIIVVDDGSTDNTTDVTQSFNDSRIHYVKHSRNKGLSAARNTGIRQSCGKYVCFLDADDYFLPNKLKDQVSFLDSHPFYGLVGGGYLRVDKNGNVVKESQPRIGPIPPEKLLVVNQLIIPSTLIRRKWIEMAGYFDEALKGAEEWDFHCRLAIVGCPMYRQSNTVCAYRLVDDSLSTDLQVQMDSRFKVIEKTFRKEKLSPELLELRNRSVAYTHLKASGQYYTTKQFEKANYHLIQALKFNPSLSENEYESVIGILLFYMDHAWIDSPAEYFDTIFNNLPEETRDLKRLRKKATYRAISHRILNSYKDKHRGKRCIVIGNGLSLRKMDLSFLKNEITIGVDRIHLLLDKYDLAPTYYVCLNPLLIDQDFEQILRIPSQKFLDLDALPYISDTNGIIFLRSANELSFVKDPREKLGQSQNATFFAMQLAYFMGFDEVILIGDDNNFTIESVWNQQAAPDRVSINHFGPTYSALEINTNFTSLEMSRKAYRLAKKTFQTEGRRIIDATLDSKLNIFPKVDYRQFFFSKSHSDAKDKVIFEGQCRDSCIDQPIKVRQSNEAAGVSHHESAIKWADPGDVPRPNAVTNIFDLALSYEQLGQSDTARRLFESILKPLGCAIDGTDYSVCSDFENSYKLAKCFMSVYAQLAQCYSKQRAWDKVKQIYLGLLNRKNLILPEQQKQDILNVLKKLQNVKIPENVLQIQPIESNKTSAAPVSNTEISRPLVSVIMPAYNAEEYIAAAIESVLNQDYRDFELVIINDGSTDNTEEIVQSFKDSRIRYFRQENRGLAATHNTGIRQSRGQFIIKLDADDKMTPDFITKHLQQFEKHPEADLVYCDDYLIDKNDKPIRIIKRPEYTDRRLLIRDLFRCGYPIVPFRTCIRRNVFDKIGFFDEKLPIGEDYDIMRRFVKHGLKISHLPNALYLRRMTENSLSRDLTPQKAKCQFELVKRFTETFSHDELFPDVEWDKIQADKIKLNAKCLSVVTYLAIGQDYLNAHSSGSYANAAFQHACSELSDCLKIDPGNRQIRDLLRKCEIGRQKYEKHSRQLVC